MEDIIKAANELEKVGYEILASLKNPDGSMKKEKHPAHEKELCDIQKKLIDYHVISCKQCFTSMKEYKENYGISTTPMCKKMHEQLKNHIEKCHICNLANKKWNEDSIPVSNSLRKYAPFLGRFFKK